MHLENFFFRGRHLFGMILPGFVFVAGICLLAGKDPILLIGGGNALVRIFAFAAIGYVIWAPIGAVTMITLRHFVPHTIAYEDLFKAGEVVQQTERIIRAGTLSNVRKLEVRKWYVRHHSPALARVVDEMEGDLSLFAGMPVALIVFLYGIVKFSLAGNSSALAWGLIMSTVVFVCAIVIAYVFFNRLVVEEGRAWCEMVLVLGNSRPPRATHAAPEM